MSEHFHKLHKFQKICSNYKNVRKSVEYKNVRTFSQITKMSENCENVGKFAKITKMSEKYFQKWYSQIFDSFTLF